MTDLPYIRAIFDAVFRSGRSERDVSLAATGKASALAMIKRGRMPSIERVRQLCEELKLEFYIGRSPLPSPGVGKILDLHYGSTPEEAAAALEFIDKLRARATDVLQARELEKRRAIFEVNAEQLHKELELFANDPNHWRDQENDYLEVPFATEMAPSPEGVAFNTEDGHKTGILRRDVPAWASHEDLVLVESPDDSMKPTFQSGDPVLLDRSKTVPLEGRLFLALWPFELAIRRVLRAGSGLILCSDSNNLSHPPVGFEPGVTLLLAEVAWHVKGLSQSQSLFWPLREWPIGKSDSH